MLIHEDDAAGANKILLSDSRAKESVIFPATVDSKKYATSRKGTGSHRFLSSENLDGWNISRIGERV
jgi:hypothetical protein